MKAVQPFLFTKSTVHEVQSRVLLSVVMSSVHFASDITSQDMLGGHADIRLAVGILLAKGISG